MRITATPFAKAIALATILFSFVNQATAQKPNIIYIMTDDMGYGDLSSYGQKKFSTPNIDKLASQGVKFTNAYSAAPVCTPTRVALMTGRYPARTTIGLFEPLTASKNDSAYGITKEHPSLGTMMKTAGYETALIGKWHLGFRPVNSPNNNGFDYFFGIHSGAADYISHNGAGGNNDLYENANPVKVYGYLTDLIGQKSVAFLEQQHTKPFFLTVMFNAPHWPWQGPTDAAYHDTANFRSGGSPATYAVMMKSLDDAVGKIMQSLEARQLLNNTIVIFTNDNGGEKFSDNGGFSKSKMSLWEGGIRVPAFVRWPGKIKEGSTTQQVAVTMDWTATILAAGGAKADKQYPLDGINLMPVLTGKQKSIDRTLYWRITQRKQEKAVLSGDWKYLKDDKGEYLFRISADPAEGNNLKDSNPDMFNKLKKLLSDWEKNVLAPIPLAG